MKLRIQGNSLRLRVKQSELADFLEDGRIEETIRFAAAPEAGLTYALELSPPGVTASSVRCTPREIAVVLTPEQVSLWREEDQVGIYTHVGIGAEGLLKIVVEKDYACLDGSDKENVDTFANPNLAANCQVG